MALTLSDIQAGIAAGSVAGLKHIYTSADAPVAVAGRECPMMIPDPRQPVASSNSTRKTWAAASGSGWQRARVYNYAVLVAEAGKGRGPFEQASTLSALLDAVENYLCDWSMAGAVSVGPVIIGGAGLVQDASGKEFHGFLAQLTVVSSY